MKSIAYFVVGLLLISGFAAVSIGEGAGEETEIITLSFSNLEVINSVDPYVEINIDGAGGRFYNPSQPVLPTYTTTLTLPFGIEVTDADCQVGDIQTETLSKKIVPAPTPVKPTIHDDPEIDYIMDSSIYGSSELFPDTWFNYNVGVGLDENKEHRSFLTISVYPVRYSPENDEVNYIEDIEITITYIVNENPFPSTATYNLVIIAPQKFSGDLQKLVTHKNSKGMQTLLMTTEDIYSQYSGVDKPEKIKYFIKDALETYDNKYVLLVGGLNSLLNGIPKDDRNQGTQDWYVPVRYTNLNDKQGGDNVFDPGFLSDLYYADVYKEGGLFEDWDEDGDGIFAKWDNMVGKDDLDFFPDVYVGRLACRNTYEVRIMVSKIVNYEESAAGASWYDTMILCGGDSFDDAGTNYLEGEVVCERIADDYMSEFNLVKLYASNRYSIPSKTPTGTNIIDWMTQGAGHIFLDGHASPMTWTTHWPDSDEWTERLNSGDFWKMLNFRKLPICAVEGCHNSQFNVSMIPAWRDKDNSAKMWTYGTLLPECWSWWLTRKIGGGSLATIGNTGLGYGAVGEHGDLDNDGIIEPDILEKYGGYYFDQFYLVFDEGAEYLGDCHSGALTNYATTHPGMDGKIDAKTLEQMTLLGDPSMKIGGYTTGNELRVEIVDAAAGVLGAPSENIMFQAASYNAQGDVTYTWDLDDDGSYDDATGEVASWSWNLPGAYWVNVKVTDQSGESDYYYTMVGIEIGADKPAKPSGPSQIKTGVDYTFATSVNTQGGYWTNTYYKFSWGDGTESEWIETPSTTHSWTQKGTYLIKVKAMMTHESAKDDDFEDAKETSWSNPLTITLSRTKSTPTPRPIIQFLQNFFENYPNAFPILRQMLGL
ncbi:MAG: PKD domain-containing protein [Thermoplasmatales archaeon]|nr:PKD domain-containing protein [Thermoplasmatales archaeon]